MGQLAYWGELYNRRLAWAFEAQRRFMERFHDPQVRTLSDQDHKDIFVAVFGPSQVGKTTLILRLIGVDPAAEQQLADELRGSRPKGQSATATAMIYGPSPDEHYYLRDPSEGLPVAYRDAAELGRRIDQLRGSVEANGTFPVNPVELYIPHHYFRQDRPADFQVRVIDLPGINSATREELAHVNKVIRHYLPQANLVLLVNRANEIASFGRFGIEAVDNWRFFPQKFRIILTHAVSNRSTKELLLERSEDDAFREHFYDQFAHTLDKFPRDDIRIYPLEYGDSWQQFLTGADDAHRYQVMMDRLFDELREDIRGTADVYSQIRMNYQFAGAVKRRLEEVEPALYQRRVELDARATQLQRRLDKLTQELLPAQKEHLMQIQEIGDAVADVDLGLKIGQAEPCQDGHQSVDRLRRAVRRAHAEIGGLANKAIVEYEELLLGTGASPLPPVARLRESELESVTSALLVRLDKYWVDWYFDLSQWDKDLAQTNAVIEKLNGRALTLAVAIIQQHWHSVRATNQREIDRARRGCTRAEGLITRQRQRLDQYEVEREAHRQALSAFEAQGRQDLEHAGRFQHFVDSAFATELRTERRRLTEPGLSPEHRFLHFTYVALLLKEYDRLREGAR